jgi:hypothetical protein
LRSLVDLSRPPKVHSGYLSLKEVNRCMLYGLVDKVTWWK